MNARESHRARTELNARTSLRVDAIYCACAGALAVLLCVPVGQLFHVPYALVAVIGVATIVWAWLLSRLARRDTWTQPLQLVAAANAAASSALVVLAVIAPALAGQLLLGAVAVEVGAFAAVQARLLRRAH